MFQHCGDHMIARIQKTLDRYIQAFCRIIRKYNLSWILCTEKLAQLVPRIIDYPFPTMNFVSKLFQRMTIHILYFFHKYKTSSLLRLIELFYNFHSIDVIYSIDKPFKKYNNLICNNI